MTCDWPVDYVGCESLPAWTPEQQETAEAMATALLWNWTGRAYGICPVQVRPCRSDCTEWFSTFWGNGPYTSGWAVVASGGWRWGPTLINGQMFNITCGVCGDNCSCDRPATLRLPGPVQEITGVRIGEDTVPVEAYRVDNHQLLVRTDGGAWPTCQLMGSMPGEAGSFVVDYTRGLPVPVGGQVAAGALAVELFKATCHDKTCQLPQRVQSITRQGVSVTMLDDFDSVQQGRTGIWLVDSWTTSVMNGARPGRVYSVDVPRPRHRRQTWPSTS